MTAGDIGKSLDVLADALWLRLRDILLAQSRWDDFVHDPEGGPQEPSPEPDESGRLASEMILRSLRVAVDPVNHGILRRLVDDEDVALTSLMRQTGLSRIALVEAINDLSQVGLATYAVETRRVRATAGCAALLRILDEMRARLARMIEERSTVGVRR